MATKRTVYLPDELASQVEAYMKAHTGMSFSTLVQETLTERVAPRHRRSILELAGLVNVDAVERTPDDRFIDRPEDSVVLRDHR